MKGEKEMFEFTSSGRIEEIWNNYITSAEYSEAPELERVTQAGLEYSGVLRELVKENPDHARMDEAVMELATAKEQEGFEAGFKYAFQMCVEIFNGGTRKRTKK